MVGWIKMKLGMQVGIGIVLDGDLAPLPQMGRVPPIFGPYLLWPNGWIHQDVTWYKDRRRPMPRCVRQGLSWPPPLKGHNSPPLRPMSIVAMVSHLSYCWALVKNDTINYAFKDFTGAERKESHSLATLKTIRANNWKVTCEYPGSAASRTLEE